MARRNRRNNLSRAARSKGGRRSAAIQKRHDGRFAGKSAIRETWDNMTS